MLAEVVLDGAASRSTGLWKPGMVLIRFLHFALVKFQLAPFSAQFSRSPENAVFVFKAANLTSRDSINTGHFVKKESARVLEIIWVMSELLCSHSVICSLVL